MQQHTIAEALAALRVQMAPPDAGVQVHFHQGVDWLPAICHVPECLHPRMSVPSR